MLSPYAGPLPAGHTLRDVETDSWKGRAATVYPRAPCNSPRTPEWARPSRASRRTWP
ncbi:hypothetical protein GCM10010433_26950 [Streptomyces pulveraceus]